MNVHLRPASARSPKASVDSPNSCARRNLWTGSPARRCWCTLVASSESVLMAVHLKDRITTPRNYQHWFTALDCQYSRPRSRVTRILYLAGMPALPLTTSGCSTTQGEDTSVMTVLRQLESFLACVHTVVPCGGVMGQAFVYQGSMMLVTRHSKARKSTNKEFHVARLLNEEDSQLLALYLVYIRPLAAVL